MYYITIVRGGVLSYDLTILLFVYICIARVGQAGVNNTHVH